MSERGRNIAVGLTTVFGIVGLIAMIFLFGYVPSFAASGYTVTIRFDDAGGLHAGSRVRLSGVDVGEVESVELLNEPKLHVRAVALIREDVRLPVGSEPLITSSLFGGGAAVEFQAPKEPVAATDLAATDGSAVFEGRVFAPIADVATEVARLSDEWAPLGANLRQLTEPTDPDAVDAGEAPANIASVIARADRRMLELKAVIADIRKLSGDEAFQGDVKETIANARALSDRMKGAVDQVSDAVDELKGSFSESATALRKRYVALADDVSGAVASMDSLLREAKDGEGTVGKLIKDPKLYDNLDDATERLQKALDEMRLLVQKWKAEGLPVQF